MNPVYVVEGRHDAMRLKAIDSSLDVVVTGGSNIQAEIIEELRLLKKTRELVLFLDPDHAGMKIRKRLESILGPCAHIHLQPGLCKDEQRNKIGVEHASNETLQNALNHIKYTHVSRGTLDYKNYQKYFIISSKSRANRQRIASTYHLPMGNGKAFYHTLVRHNISEAMIEEGLDNDESKS